MEEEEDDAHAHGTEPRDGGPVSRLRAGDPYVWALCAAAAHFVCTVPLLRELLPAAILASIVSAAAFAVCRRKLAKELAAARKAIAAAGSWSSATPLENTAWVNWALVATWQSVLRHKASDEMYASLDKALKRSKMPWFVQSASICQCTIGDCAPVLSGFQVMRNKFGREVCEADMAFHTRNMRVAIRIKLKSENYFINVITANLLNSEIILGIENLQVKGRVRGFPLQGHPIMLQCFVTPPKVRFDTSISNVSLTSVPAIKSWLGDVMSDTIAKTAVYPYMIGVELMPKSGVKHPVSGHLEVTLHRATLWHRAAQSLLSATAGLTSNDWSMSIVVGKTKHVIDLFEDDELLPGEEARPDYTRLRPVDGGVPLSFIVAKGNSQVMMRGSGLETFDSLVCWRWSTRTRCTHVWHPAAISGFQTDAHKLETGDTARLKVGLWQLDETKTDAQPSTPGRRVADGTTTAASSEHTTAVNDDGRDKFMVGELELDVRFRWAEVVEGPGQGAVDPSMEVLPHARTAPAAVATHDATRRCASSAAGALSPEGLLTKLQSSLVDQGSREYGVWQVDIVRGFNLVSRDDNGLSDPFVSVKVGKKKQKTKVRYLTLNPVWEQRMFFTMEGVHKGMMRMRLKCFDFDSYSFTDDFLGSTEIDLYPYQDGQPHELRLTLSAIERGELLIRVMFHAGHEKPPTGGWSIEPLVRVHKSEHEAIESAYVDQVNRAVLNSDPTNGAVNAEEGMMHVTLIEATSLVPADINGKSDPYCNLRIGSEMTHTSSVRTSTLNPWWMETFCFRVDAHARLHGRLLIEVRDKDYFTNDDYLGNAAFPLSEVRGDGESYETWLPLEGFHNTTGALRVALQFIPFERQSTDDEARSPSLLRVQSAPAKQGAPAEAASAPSSPQPPADGKAPAPSPRRRRLSSCFSL